MRRARFLVSLVVLAAALALAWRQLHRPPPPQALANGAALQWIDCWFPVPYFRPVYCGRFRTAGAGAARFSLPVVYVPARPWRRVATPVLYIAGGPGGATPLDAAAAPGWLAWVDAVGWPHDTVFYDQRGVGLSDPALDCPELRIERRAQLPLDLDTETAGRRQRAAAERCRARLEAAGHDLGRFTTRANAEDARDLMAALGAPRWDLYGVSYGSRVALELLRLAPERLRAVVLDSVYPPEVEQELADPWLLARALGLVTRICELLDECQRDPAQIAADLATVLRRLQDAPLRIRVPTPAGEGELDVFYNAESFAWLLFEALYRWERLAGLPRTLALLAAGRQSADLQVLGAEHLATALDAGISDAVGGAVDCNDAGWVTAAAFAAARAQFPAVQALTRSDWDTHPCRTWKAGDAGVEFRQPVYANVPTLLLAGEFDPVTPPQWAAAAADRLPAGFLFEFPAVGHGVLDSHECAVDLVKAFLAAPLSPVAPACLGAL